MSTPHSSLTFQACSGRTSLVAATSHLPLIFQRPLHAQNGAAVAVMLTPAGALFDGDDVQLEVECGPYTDVTLTTASATKLNRCDSGEIQFAMQVRVAAGATFRYLPHELIPFRGTRYRQRLSVDLHGSGQAWLLEVVTPGPSNARFAFTRLDLATRVSHDAKVVVRERFAITPDAADQLHGQTHYGSLLLLGSNIPDASRLNARLGCEHDAGATALPSHGVGLKALGASAHQVRQTLLEAARLPGWLQVLLPP